MSAGAAEARRRSYALALIGLLAVGRLLVGAMTPLTPDEAYYALWARSLGAGYFDHPPMIAYFIRAGTVLFGETPLGVRLVCMLSAIPATILVWRAAEILLIERSRAPQAALLFNVTLIGYFGMAVATPDAPLVLFSAAMLYGAARLTETDSLSAWIVMGLATGLAFEAKYSAALLAAGFALAVLVVPAWRRQLATPRPWLALAVALLVFAPNIVWNAQHGWATFAKQGGRVTRETPFSLQYLPELVVAQIGMATPFIFALAVLGLLPRVAGAYRNTGARRIVLCLVLVPTAYFAFHALRARVEGNWPGFLYPALAVSAAAALAPTAGRIRGFLSRTATPLGLAIALIGTLYVVAGPLPALGRKDPILRMSQGWDTLADDIRALAARSGASYVITYDYQLNAELALLLPELRVAQGSEPERYAMLSEPRLASLTGPGLVLTRNDIRPTLEKLFGTVEPLGTVEQRYGETVVTRFFAYRIDRPPLP